ncbi:hypothetical protein N431DRAFT_479427 [Stipitochalara longipes BDJ]|nr:hypothetical protein N431DRAFT_479427 [Stipitochalara longipes BDJ]
MAHLTSHLGAMLAFLCFLVALVAGNPVRLTEDKRAIGLPSHAGFPNPSRTGSASHISHLSHNSTRIEEHHSWSTKTGTNAYPASHHEHTRTSTHKSHETEHYGSSLADKTSSDKTPGHYTVEKREVSVIISIAGSSTAEASHDIPHPSHSPHTATYPPHSAYSTHVSHTAHSTHKEVHHSHTKNDHSTGTEQTHVSTTPVASITKSASVSYFPPTRPPFHDPRDIEMQGHHKSSSVYTFNPATLQNATTIALPSTTYCVTTLYLPHSPVFGPSTKTVWTSTATLYPEWDCHGCASLTVLDPWTMGQPTTHYHHTKTSKSMISVVSPVCKATETSIAVTLTAA